MRTETNVQAAFEWRSIACYGLGYHEVGDQATTIRLKNGLGSGPHSFGSGAPTT
jgi:hypothetical protein